MDPDMREAKTFIDGLRYRIPGERQTLLPKRDWLGAPIDNPQYGSIIRNRAVNLDPVNLEMALLGLHAAPPPDRVGGVKLPPRMYDEYQVKAGAITRPALEQFINSPGWYDQPAFVREEVFKKTIALSRQQAAAELQMGHPDIWETKLQNIRNHIEGNKAIKLQDAAQ
jgi:hypothetical protein